MGFASIGKESELRNGKKAGLIKGKPPLSTKRIRVQKGVGRITKRVGSRLRVVLRCANAEGDAVPIVSESYCAFLLPLELRSQS